MTTITVEPVGPLRPTLRTVLYPKWRSAVARFRKEQSGASVRLLLLGLLGLGFWSGTFGIVYRVLKYFKGVDEIGSLLAGKLLGMSLLAFLGILLLSNLITALSTFFLAKDLDLVVAAPVDWLWFYLAKLTETLLHSSWMVVLLMVPIFAAYGIVYDGGPLFPIVALSTLVPFLILPAALGTAITLILVNLFPARRTRDLLSLIAAGTAAGAVLLLRLMQPERLARPEGFRSLLDFIAVLRAPASPLLPSEWTGQVIMNWLLRVADPLPIALLWTTAGAFVVLGAALHARLYQSGFTKAQEGAESFVRGTRLARVLAPVARLVSPAQAEFLLKDLRLFFRDTTQWSQLILLAVLLLVYLFNIRSLPLFTGEQVPFFLVTLVTFLNQGLAGFILAAIAARFVFPALSLEGKQMWLIRSSPLELRTMLWSKYCIGLVPLLLLAVGITWATGMLLRASGTMLAIGVVSTCAFTVAIAALALCFGTLYPQFETENAAQIPTSFGGLVYMMASVCLLALILAIEAGPVADMLRARHESLEAGLGAVGTAVAVVVGLCLLTAWGALRIALERIEAMEW
ncbi:MAG: putative ABC transporter permease subunit [Gemmatimonadota bacterium]